MIDSDLFDAVAHVTGEDSQKIRRRGFVLAGQRNASLANDPECLLVFPEAGTVYWGVRGFGCGEPFFVSTLKARSKKRAGHAEPFRFSILEVCDLNASDEFILGRECHLKTVLRTRDFGLNGN